jgi:molecular chaperone GrpE
MINDNNKPETGNEEGAASTPKPEQAEEQEGAAASTEEMAQPDGAPENGDSQTYEELTLENADLKDKLLRVIAEMENLRRRTAREKVEAQKFGIRKFAEDLLSVADNLKRALAAVPQEIRASAEETFESLLTGVEMTDKQLHDIFDRHGIKLVLPENEKFDPNLHHAIAEVPDSGHPQGTVIDVVQTGYLIEDRLLRPAMVTVAKGPHPAKQVDPNAAAPESEGGSENL